MAVSALAGVFREFTLTYSAATGSTTVDAYGNPIPVYTTGALVVNFEASQSPQLIFAEGADPKIVRGKGSCIDPVTLPAAIGPGTEFDLTWSGRAGKLRILQASLDPLAILDTVLGQEFIAEWRAV